MQGIENKQKAINNTLFGKDTIDPARKVELEKELASLSEKSSLFSSQIPELEEAYKDHEQKHQILSKAIREKQESEYAKRTEEASESKELEKNIAKKVDVVEDENPLEEVKKKRGALK
jgi:hypothetical protein